MSVKHAFIPKMSVKYTEMCVKHAFIPKISINYTEMCIKHTIMVICFFLKKNSNYL